MGSDRVYKYDFFLLLSFHAHNCITFDSPKIKPNDVAEVEGGTVRSNLYLLTGITSKEKKEKKHSDRTTIDSKDATLNRPFSAVIALSCVFRVKNGRNNV